MNRLDVMLAIEAERHRQEALKAAGKFPMSCADREASNLRRMAILTEEVGEVCRVVNEEADGHGLDREALRTELVQVAAVAVAWLEGLQKPG